MSMLWTHCVMLPWELKRIVKLESVQVNILLMFFRVVGAVVVIRQGLKADDMRRIVESI